MTQGPVTIDLDAETPIAAPQDAPAVPDLAQGAAMQQVAAIATRRPTSRWAKLFWSALIALVGFVVSVAVWDFVSGLLTRNSVLGGIAMALCAAVLLGLLVVGLRELSALARLRRVDGLREAAEAARLSGDLKQARSAVDQIERLYKGRADAEWGLSELRDHRGDAFDADALFDLTEAHLLRPMDDAAQREVEAAARQVATVTALVPLALTDLISALVANLRMIRRVAEIYGGRGGLLGNWRLTRAVMAHLVATGAMAVGEDMLEPLIGGGVVGKLSRRFGEGLVNGALTARVGVAAMEVCRPLSFSDGKRPKVRKITQRALTGLFSGGGRNEQD